MKIEVPLANSANGGAWPSLFNVALNAAITSNATCGENGKEEYCRIKEPK